MWGLVRRGQRVLNVDVHIVAGDWSGRVVPGVVDLLDGECRIFRVGATFLRPCLLRYWFKPTIPRKSWAVVAGS
jgi:hypothetical protein